MIGLIAAGRDGGGHEPPVFFTVPWSPSIEARGEMPGKVMARLRLLREVLVSSGELPKFCTMTEREIVAMALNTPGYDVCAALGVTIARRIMLELGMLP